MRAFPVCLIGLAIVASGSSLAQPKPSAAGSESRYFTSIDGLMDGNADVVLKENYQGKTVTSAVLDVCYPAAQGSDRRDRFVVNLTVNGQTMAGTGETQVDKLPVSVSLTRKATGDTYEFKGQIRVGQTVTNVVSTDNADLSEKEFRENQVTDDGIVASPKDFTEVSPEALAVKVKLENAPALLAVLKGQHVGVALGSLTVSCEALRRGQMTISLSTDPQQAADLLAKLKSQPGVSAAGWTSGLFDMERTVRFASDGWLADGRPDRTKLAGGIAAVAEKILAAKLASSSWSDETGRLTLVLKRPADVFPELSLTETIELNALVSPDRPGASDHLMLWVGQPSITVVDESAAAKLHLIDTLDDDSEGDHSDEIGIVDAMAKEFKAQRWDLENAVWK